MGVRDRRLASVGRESVPGPTRHDSQRTVHDSKRSPRIHPKSPKAGVRPRLDISRMVTVYDRAGQQSRVTAGATCAGSEGLWPAGLFPAGDLVGLGDRAGRRPGTLLVSQHGRPGRTDLEARSRSCWTRCCGSRPTMGPSETGNATAPRTLDLDLLLVGELRSKTPPAAAAAPADVGAALRARAPGRDRARVCATRPARRNRTASAGAATNGGPERRSLASVSVRLPCL